MICSLLDVDFCLLLLELRCLLMFQFGFYDFLIASLFFYLFFSLSNDLASLSRTLPSRKHALHNSDQFSLEHFKNEQMKLYNSNINNINLKNGAHILNSNSSHSNMNYRYSQNALNNYYRIHHNYNYKYLPHQFRQQLHQQVRYDQGNLDKDTSSIYSNHGTILSSCGPGLGNNGSGGGNGVNMTNSNCSNTTSNSPLNYSSNSNNNNLNKNSDAIYTSHNNTNHKRRSTQLYNL